MAGNPGTDPQRQFLTLIRNFATEKSQGERRIVDLKKQTEEIRSEVEAANSELREAKHAKEITEQELRGYEVELALSETSIQSLKSRIALIQDEISTVGSELDAIKNEEGALRDEFISQMFEHNAKIRKFQETFTCSFEEDHSFGTIAGGQKLVKNELNEADLKSLEDSIAHVLYLITAKEEECHSEESLQKQTQQEFFDYERKVSLIEVIMKTTRELEELTREISVVSLTRNKQTSELEQMSASIGEGLQRRCICPNCHLDNVELISEILQPSEAN